MEVDPYAELDVPRDATPAQIRAAYKKKAKTTHPDRTGGDAEAFTRVGRALEILEDPKKRAQYDADGTVTEEKNAERLAVEMIAQAMSGILGDYLKSGLRPEKDPRNVDVVAIIARKFEDELVGLERQIEMGAGVRETVLDIRDRFTRAEPGDVGDVIKGMFDQTLRDHARATEQVEKEIAVRKIALTVVRKYKFRSNAYQQMGGVFMRTF